MQIEKLLHEDDFENDLSQWVVTPPSPRHRLFHRLFHWPLFQKQIPPQLGLADGVASHGGQTIETFAHVARLEGDIDLEISVEAEHGRISLGF